MTNTGTPAPAGFTANDRCPNCRGLGQVEDSLNQEEDMDADMIDCDDCDGVGWVKPVAETPLAVRVAERVAAHAEFVAQYGPGASCGGAYCRCPR